MTEAQKHFLELEKKKEEPEQEITKYTDEFFDSIDYLNTLSKNKKIESEREMFEKKNKKRREDLQKKTLKNHNSSRHLNEKNKNVVKNKRMVINALFKAMSNIFKIKNTFRLDL